jgi:methylaspartate mutase epsilon subunit
MGWPPLRTKPPYDMLSKFLNARTGLYVQPRMGMGTLENMRKGLQAVKTLEAAAVGTITLDSYTRMEQYEEAEKALQAGLDLNGFPVLAYEPCDIMAHLTALGSDDFLIQVRHGTARPEKIFQQLVKSRLFLTEGGPVSYCLPYSRLPLREAIASWQRACHILADYPEKSHLESFAGCLLGQLCHPAILVSLGILEALFFQQNGLRDISLSYAQNYSLTQDLAAVSALKRLANLYLTEEMSWHIVIYTFMGLFPQTMRGYEKILGTSVHLAVLSGAKRLIVKTHEESRQIPSVAANLNALRKAHGFSAHPPEGIVYDAEEEEIIFYQAKALIDSALNSGRDIGAGLYQAFQEGRLDVPFCLHPDNRRLATCIIDQNGYLQWVSSGKLPIAVKKNKGDASNIPSLTSSKFLEMLGFNRQKFDC